MAKDSSLYVRQAVLDRLKNAPTMTALVPAARIYPPQRPSQPQVPFIGYGVAVAIPFGASCLDGCTVSVPIHGYAETHGEGVDTVDGEEYCASIMRVIVSLLGGEEGAAIPLDAASGGITDCPYPATAYVQWTGTQVIQDGTDASAFHGIANFDITVSS